MKYVFFGSSDFSVHVLNELESSALLPSLIVTTPDKPKGRKLILTPNPVKVWGEGKGIPVIDPKNLKKDALQVVDRLKQEEAELFLVASYGKIIPKEIFEIPGHGTLNIHPSLLPKYRGASPIIAQILNDAGGPESNEGIGVTIMQIDEGMDTGPIVLQRKVKIDNWPISRLELEKITAEVGAHMFVEVVEGWVKGEVKAEPQDDSRATLCGKNEKEDGLLDLSDDPRKNLLKIKAFVGWPTAYYFMNGRRIIITDATIEDNKLKILKVIPEGKKEMPYQDFLRGQK